MTKYTFRAMKRTTTLLQAQCALLLSVDGLGYSNEDYALFYAMGELIHQTHNPTYKQAYGSLGGLFSLYRRLVSKLAEDSDLRRQCEAEWVKLGTGYEQLLEVKTQ